MCWMMIKEAGRKIRFDYMDKAQKHNSDGYGVSWYEDGMVKTYKTFNYNTFKGIVRALKKYTIVVHLRYATKGSKEYDNIHPFDIPSGVMFHNGTMSRLGNSSKSDSKELASIINECDYKYIEDIEPLIKPFINDKINRLVFFEDNGRITIMNRELGIEEDGTWYSNDYHLKDDGWCRTSYNYKKKVENNIKKHKVFVYGTLKRGYGNNKHYLSNATFLGKAMTKDRWSMIGSRAFPYLLERDEEGYHIKGEVFAVSDSELRELDRLEGVPHHYRKETIKVNYSDDLSEDTVTVYVKTHVLSNYKATNDLIECWEG